MKKYTPLLLFFFALIGCKDDDGPVTILEQICLTEVAIEETNASCESTFVNQDCETIHVGHKSLSENIKSDFADFCNVPGSELDFIDSNGNIMTGYINKRAFQTGTYAILSGVNDPNCIKYCLENEEALIELITDKFSLELTLKTGLNFGIDSTNASEKIVSEFTIWSIYGNRRQVIFSIDLEDYFDEPIMPDTTYARYHNDITLNNTNYTELYSNENNNATGLVREEKVYFHPQDGLIAVRDSQGVLWTRN